MSKKNEEQEQIEEKEQIEENEDIFDLFMRFNTLMHRYGHHVRREAGLFGDPRRGQGRVLSLLKMKPEISQKDLAYLLDMRPQSLGELLGKLEKSGLITRTPSETDRRVMIVKLTPEGEMAAEPAETNRWDDIFGALDEDEKEQMSVYLKRLIEALEQKTEDYGDDPHRQGFFGRFGGFRSSSHGRPEGHPFEDGLGGDDDSKSRGRRGHPFRRDFTNR